MISWYVVSGFSFDETRCAVQQILIMVQSSQRGRIEYFINILLSMVMNRIVGSSCLTI